MKLVKKSVHRRHRGAALIISMIFVLIFSALAVSLATISGTNVQLADNQRKADCTRACAESGLDIIRFWLSRISISGLTAPSEIFEQIATSLQGDLTANEISNITPTYDGSTITVPTVTLNLAKEQSFSAKIIPLPPLDAPNMLQADVTGVYGSITRTIRANFKFGAKTHTVFDYGVATKGPLHLAGNIELEGVNISVESDVYIESEYENEALSIIGNSQIAGNVKITNPDAYVTLQGGQAGIGGETGDAALEHVSIGQSPPEFPVPNPDYFEHYVVEDINYPSAETTFENIRIPANTNPSFGGDITLKGIVFIETPNIVTFTGNTDITGIIVGNGDLNDNSGTNQINFLGTIDSHSVTELPEQFDQLRDETGTFMLAPGFSVSFSGNFSTLNGAIAANGIEFSGDAGGTINGSVVNYSGEPMTLTGNSDLYFNRSDTTKLPAGFVQDIVLQYDPTSYAEGPF